MPGNNVTDYIGTNNVHMDDRDVRAAAERIGQAIATLMATGTGPG